MIKLYGRVAGTWDAEPMIARVTRNSALHNAVRSREALLLEPTATEAPEGFRAYLKIGANTEEGTSQPGGAHVFTIPSELSYLEDGDILRLMPRSGQFRVLYRRSSRFNYLLMTERCNSNCVMCSQPPRDVDDSFLVKDYIEAIPLMHPDTPQLGITGGEPTLLGDDLLHIIRMCKNYLPSTYLHMLSNGRLSSYLTLCQAISEIKHPNFMIGIPVYSDLPHEHDFVVQAAGAFDQTIRGIMNLKRYGLRVEIRVVLHRYTVDRLPDLARFIVRNLPFVDHVALMGLELMGYTRMNLDALWVDPVDYQEKLGTAVSTLAASRMNVSIYNHQLCVLRRDLWQYAKMSISDWKNEYIKECDTCSVRSECGGFFSSGLLRYSAHIRSVPSAETNKSVQPMAEVH